MGENKSVPWKDGYYRYKSTSLWTFVVKGEEMIMCNPGCVELQINEPREVTKGTLKFGSYEESLPEIEKVTGKKNYDVEMTYWGGAMKSRGSLTNDGNRIIMPGLFIPNGELEEFYWISQEEFEKLRDAGEPIEAMSCPYKIEPERLGKLLWISGPPGAGKSTSAQLLCRNTGFVYYEADCVMNHANPYIPADVENPSMSQMFQKHCKGITQENEDGVQDLNEFYMKLSEAELDEVKGARAYKYMSECIGYERKRIGGDWAVAQAVPTRRLRDVIRKNLGNDKVVFILIGLDTEATRKRLNKRHGESEEGLTMTDFLMKVNSFYELKAADEENTYDVIVTNEMTPNDVVQKMMEIINQL